MKRILHERIHFGKPEGHRDFLLNDDIRLSR
jgi:hypothetical protein